MLELMQLVGICFVMPLLLSILLSGRWNQARSLLLSLAAAAAFTANLAALSVLPDLLPKFPFLEALKWNWLGKVMAILSTLVVYLLLPKKHKVEAGLFARPKPPEWVSVLAVSVVTVVGFSAISWSQNTGEIGTTLETTLYQATMPGLDEESCLRGTVLALLVGAFGKPLRFAGISFGWGALPIVVMFGLAHGFSANAAGVAVNWPTVLITGVMGISFLWLKERTKSIWVPVLVHNLANVGATYFGGG